jgi:Uma2 family endonuclease
MSTAFTPDDLLTLPDGDRYELLDGQLVERPMSVLSSYIAGNVYNLLAKCCQLHCPGWVLPGGITYHCFPDDPDKVRMVHVSLIRLERWPIEQARAAGHVPIAPDLAVEVVPADDFSGYVDGKVEDLLRAGVRLVWVVNPASRTVWVRRADGTSATFHEQDELTGEDVLPGFRCRVGDLFVLPQPAP